MGFHGNLKQEMHETNGYSCDELEYADDVSYHELRRQVMKLIDEDDGVDGMLEARKQSPNHGPSRISRPRWHYNWPGNQDECAAPSWIINLWGTSKGTGVFIPQIVRPKRKQNQEERSITGEENTSEPKIRGSHRLSQHTSSTIPSRILVTRSARHARISIIEPRFNANNGVGK